jgi:hypothetical protein
MASLVIAEVIVALQATHRRQGGRVVWGGAGDLGGSGRDGLKGSVLVVDGLGKVVVGRSCLCCIGVGAIVQVEFCMVSVTLGLIYHAGADVATFGTNSPEGITPFTVQ